MARSLETDQFVTGIRPYWRRMVVNYQPGERIEHLYLDFYDEKLTDDDVYGIVSYLRFNGLWMVREVSWRYEDRIRPVLLTFIRRTPCPIPDATPSSTTPV